MATLIGAPVVIPSAVGSPPRVGREPRREAVPPTDIPSVDAAVAQASETLDLEPLPPVMTLPAAPTQPTTVPPPPPMLAPMAGPPPMLAPMAGPPPTYDTFANQSRASQPMPQLGAAMLGAQPRRPRWIWPLVAVVVAGGGAAAGWWYSQRSPSTPPAIAATHDAGVVVEVARDAAPVVAMAAASDAAAGAAASADAAVAVAVAVAASDAAPVATAGPDAAPAVAGGDPPPQLTGGGAGPDGDLVLDSTPSRIRVFLDGAEVGKTPLTLPGSADRHSLAMAAPGHELYLAEVDGRGKFSITLREVAPAEGPAGIKVRCKQKDRYYVFLDGKPTGQLCPTERLGVELGAHVVEIHDLVTETRRQFPVTVKETRNSLRVRVD